ncbi:Acyl-coenzyme A thioesterase [Paratrimastix pyriformis]|uniref:Acyl-coenzyme A thioesterase n=1 Tax=Paratrimastix pyriformis TaxID=342808 RepID=A0ABQ8UME5_9EUKA|nr:Acyl-coenzyme A thioesterase [Paratrimastix pyriformis]
MSSPEARRAYRQRAEEAMRTVLRYDQETEKEGWELKQVTEGPDGPIRAYTKLFSGLACLKSYGHVDAASRAIFRLICDYPRRSELDPNYQSITVLEQIDEQVAVTHSKFAAMLGGLISSRDFVAVAFQAEADGALLIAATGVEHLLPATKGRRFPALLTSRIQNPERISGYVRGETFPSAWIIRPEGENRSRVTYIAHANIKGMIPTGLINRALASTAATFYQRAHALLASAPVRPPPEEQDQQPQSGTGK